MSESSAVFTFAIVIVAGIIAGRFAELYNFPKTIPLILTGILLAIVGNFDASPIDLASIHDTTLLVIELALITVLFREGMHLNLGSIRKHLLTIVLIATAGTILTTLLVGSVFALLFPFSLIIALLLGAILTPTDPAATFSILRSGSTRIKEKFETILGGEAALNDVVAIILVVVVLIPAVAQGSGGQITFTLDILFEALWQFIGGSLLGLIIGILTLVLVQILSTRIEESLFSLSAALLIFTLSIITGTNSAIGALVAGIVLGNPGFFRVKSDYLQSHMHTFWDSVVFFFEIFAFIFIGASFSIAFFLSDFRLIIFGIVASAIILTGRIIGIFLITSPLETSKRYEEEFNNQERIFVGFSGLKGLTTAVLASFAFLELEDILVGTLSLGQLILQISVLVIIVTGIVQGIFLKTVAQKTGVLKTFEQIEMDEIDAQRLILESSLNFLVDQVQEKKIKASDLPRITIPLREKLYLIKEHLGYIEGEQMRDKEFLEIHLQLNRNSRTILAKAHDKGDIKHLTYEKLVQDLQEEQKELIRYLNKSISGEELVKFKETVLIKEELDLLEEEILLLENPKPARFSNDLDKIKTGLKRVRKQLQNQKIKRQEQKSKSSG